MTTFPPVGAKMFAILLLKYSHGNRIFKAVSLDPPGIGGRGFLRITKSVKAGCGP
jgi:hypothetical protein